MVCFVSEQKRSNVPVTQASPELLSTSACVGADCLMKLLGNYCRNLDIKTAITVGVVGKEHVPTLKSSFLSMQNISRHSKIIHCVF